MNNIFRLLVISAMLFYVLWFCAPYLDSYIKDPNVQDLLLWHGYGAIIKPTDIEAYVWLLVYGLLSIGLVYFKAWARTAFLVVTVLAVTLILASGMTIHTVYEQILLQIVTLLDGAIIAMAYFSKLKDEFK